MYDRNEIDARTVFSIKRQIEEFIKLVIYFPNKTDIRLHKQKIRIMNASVEKMIAQYLLAWNENNLEAYKEEFSKCWAPEATYSDPFGEYKGVDGISNFAQKSLEIVPERKFKILENPEYHHKFGKYAWMVEFEGKTNVGYDYFEFNDNFEITRLVSFFKLPEDYPLEKLA
jgi:hypothetical protein